MINISGKFVHQPPSSPAPDFSFPATFLICPMIVADDGVPVFDPQTGPGLSRQGKPRRQWH